MINKLRLLKESILSEGWMDGNFTRTDDPVQDAESYYSREDEEGEKISPSVKDFIDDTFLTNFETIIESIYFLNMYNLDDEKSRKLARYINKCFEQIDDEIEDFDSVGIEEVEEAAKFSLGIDFKDPIFLKIKKIFRFLYRDTLQDNSQIKELVELANKLRLKIKLEPSLKDEEYLGTYLDKRIHKLEIIEKMQRYYNPFSNKFKIRSNTRK